MCSKGKVPLFGLQTAVKVDKLEQEEEGLVFRYVISPPSPSSAAALTYAETMNLKQMDACAEFSRRQTTEGKNPC